MGCYFLLYLLISSWISIINYGDCGVITRHTIDVKTLTGALKYLDKFGYTNVINDGKSSKIRTISEFETAVRDFQKFAHIPVTGKLDNETIVLMNTPRCGVRDKKITNSTRKKRYALHGSRWKNRDLTYKITKYPDYLSKEEVDKDIAKSFLVWSKVADIRFKPTNEPVPNIEIMFVAGAHGDGDPFDGPGGTLAHAFFPIYGGDVHFDDTESWTTKGHGGTNLYQVATHEFGHSLGLSHTDNQHALMAPFYRGYVPNIELHDDDIQGIQELYGANPNYHKKLATAIGKASGENSGLCGQPFDAITTFSDRKTYVFKGSYAYKLIHEGGIVPGYPRKIQDEFVGLPSNIDAAFTWLNDATYVFKKSQYWKLVNKAMEPGYPRLISAGFPGIPNDLDAAFVWGGNSRIYFFKGNSYWKYDPNVKGSAVPPDYPKSIGLWKGVPNNINGATLYRNGLTYFFKNGVYYRFNDTRFEVDTGGLVPFPRNAGKYWFECK